MLPVAKSNEGYGLWVGRLSRFNSVRMQTELLAHALRLVKSKPCAVLGDHNEGLALLRRDFSGFCGQLIWPYGGFDSRLWRTFRWRSNRKPIYVYHNITPASYYWSAEPKVALGAIAGRLQLALAPKSMRWVTCSRYNQRELLRMGFTSVQLCSNIVDSHMGAFGKMKEGDRVLFVGRIAPNKRCLELVRYVRKVADQLRKRIVLTIVGDRKPHCAYADAFDRELHRIKESNSWLLVELFHSALTDKEMRDKYAAATVYVSASHHEGFGLPVCESIAAGTPALYVECGGTEDVLNREGMIARAQEHVFPMFLAQLLVSEPSRQALWDAQRKYVEMMTIPHVLRAINSVF